MYRELVESSDNIIIVTDPNFNIRYVSSAVVKSFNIQPDHLLGKNVLDFVPSEKIEDWKKSLATTHAAFTGEISLDVAKGKKAYFDVHVSNLLHRYDVQGVALHLHDITKKKQKENDLIRSNQQMDQVIYKTTHDLKAPLMSALGLVNLAEKATEDEKGRYIQMIKKSLLKLDAFIEEMNDFFRNEKLAIQRDLIGIEEMLREEIENLHNLPEGRKVSVSFHIDGETPFYSDTIRVKTIVTNILSNAIKYSDPKKSEPFIRISVLLNEEFCQLRIVDNGIGIDSKFQDKIFDLFFRATTQSQGTGIGLFIVKDTIQKLRGTIDVKSTLGEGTVFDIRIPNQIFQPVEAD
ncbi:MAG TPA: ATP-binding protein [Chryseosolibacter sp.]|nr:ATP-binding protein [Chryseosolibacter sp.]